MFNHVGNELIDLKAESINGVRYYTIPTGKKYPSITSVTSFKKNQGIIDWRKRVGDVEADRIIKESTARGTKFHSYAEDYLNNLFKKPTELAEQASKAYEMFESARPYLDNINNIHALEAPLYSDYLGVAGRVDCIAEYNGELSIIDFKTSNKPKPVEWIESYFVQEVAYAYMYYERTGIEVKKLVTIMASTTGEMQIFEIYDKMKYIELLRNYINEFVKFHTGAKFSNA